PYGKAGCAGGWYAIRPRGFVCAGEGVTLHAEIAALLPAPPELGRPLPYRYGRARTQGTPAYRWMPGAGELSEAEPDLGRHLAKMEREQAPLGAGANDVPLDARGVASGPPVLLPTGDGVGADGKRTEASYFVFAAAPQPAPFVALTALGGDLGTKAAALRKGSGVAITRALSAAGGAEAEGRRFGMTPEGLLVPADRLQAALGSTWHGLDVEKLGLPIAFVHKFEVHAWRLGRGEATKTDEELERHAAVPLTGRFRTVDGVRFEEARDGYWLRAQDLVVVVKRSKWPEFAKGSQKWLDVSLANQTLTAYEGQKPVYATLISSGRDQLQDPATTASTPRGTFRVRSKHVTRDLDPREVSEGFDVADAPWVLELEAGTAITGNYWSDIVGEARTFHNVALAPIDARRIWSWSEPELPEGWHAVTSADGEGTIVNVRP
ncbi:MAG: L,D-transpeptidase, partial [Polyangiaceae bacterium]|nr:L,D-transpeptidase [Polyangiaceae bacterium]